MNTLLWEETSKKKFRKLVRICLFLLLVGVAARITTASAQPVLFDFNSAPIHTSLPLTLSAGGITAQFSSTGQGFSIQDYFGNTFIPIGFSGLFICPNGLNASDLVVRFDRTLTNFSILYAPEEYGCDSSATMRVTAYMNGVYVGTNTKIAGIPGTWPVDTLSCSFPQGFDSVVVHYDHHPVSGCTDWGPIFAADDMVVTPSPTQSPLVSTDIASNITTVSATLNGTVNASGSTTTAMFEWGTTTAYGNFTPPETISVASSPQAISFILSTLLPATTYHYRVTATNNSGTSNGADEFFTTASVPPDTVHVYAVQNRWNLLSVPITMNDYTKTLLYPAAVSEAYVYQNGYVTQAVLGNGFGYWLKFGSAQSDTLRGTLRSRDSMSVQAGWNLIGSISFPVATSLITSVPGGMITSGFYGYRDGYLAADTIQPGKGYWVKVNQSGKLILATGVMTPAKNRIRILWHGEPPPPAPDNRGLEVSSNIPAQFTLAQNYPNPFNPSTRFSYSLPTTAWVTLKVCDVLGQEVATVVEGQEGAGYKSVEFDGSFLSSGIYFYRLNAVSATDPHSAFAQVGKMLILK